MESVETTGPSSIFNLRLEVSKFFPAWIWIVLWPQTILSRLQRSGVKTREHFDNVKWDPGEIICPVVPSITQHWRYHDSWVYLKLLFYSWGGGDILKFRNNVLESLLLRFFCKPRIKLTGFWTICLWPVLLFAKRWNNKDWPYWTSRRNCFFTDF